MNTENVTRLLKDVRQIMKNPLHENGIYYAHDDENMLKGYALIVGPSETPYFGGFYFFQFEFPKNYPFSPPFVTYMTNNGHTRFHPNLYINGKVCVSILNTWVGEKWSSCQTISSVLLTFCSLLTRHPFLHEPGQTIESCDNNPYTKSITYQNINFAICEIIMNFPEKFKMFESVSYNTFLKNYDSIYAFVEKQNEINNNQQKCYDVILYKMKTIVDYSVLKEKMNKTKEFVLEKIKN
jgi:ubiquitin-conjugating enzyme E2 Z